VDCEIRVRGIREPDTKLTTHWRVASRPKSKSGQRHFRYGIEKALGIAKDLEYLGMRVSYGIVN